MLGGGLLWGGSVVSPGEATAGARAGALRGGIPVCPQCLCSRQLSLKAAPSVDFHCTVASRVSLFPWVSD